MFYYSVNIISVNRSFLKFVTDFGPLLIFLIVYYNGDKNLKVAIPPFIVATLIALTVVWFIEKKIPMVPLLGGIFITLFGGLTIYFDNPVFIYVKPTIINILFGLALFLTIISPLLQLYQRTGSKSLILAGFLATMQ